MSRSCWRPEPWRQALAYDPRDRWRLRVDALGRDHCGRHDAERSRTREVTHAMCAHEPAQYRSRRGRARRFRGGRASAPDKPASREQPRARRAGPARGRRKIATRGRIFVTARQRNGEAEGGIWRTARLGPLRDERAAWRATGLCAADMGKSFSDNLVTLRQPTQNPGTLSSACLVSVYRTGVSYGGAPA